MSRRSRKAMAEKTPPTPLPPVPAERLELDRNHPRHRPPGIGLPKPNLDLPAVIVDSADRVIERPEEPPDAVAGQLGAGGHASPSSEALRSEHALADGRSSAGVDGSAGQVDDIEGTARARAEEIEAAAWRVAAALVAEARDEAASLRAAAAQAREDAATLLAEAKAQAATVRAEAEAEASRYREVLRSAQHDAEEKLKAAIALARQERRHP